MGCPLEGSSMEKTENLAIPRTCRGSPDPRVSDHEAGQRYVFPSQENFRSAGAHWVSFEVSLIK